ncbi:MAG TPA: response regulator transcription factor [Planctomycetota bacterium]|nr:response regulator transcription factor [Planctomycetota bacterium]
MRILIADDERFSLHLLKTVLTKEGNEIVACSAGDEALRVLREPAHPEIAILDWMMPGLNGIDVCREARAIPGLSTYLILLTSRDGTQDLLEGLAAGADDYIVKPFNPAELQARVDVGARIVTLQRRLADRVGELESALQKVKQLQGLLPICSYCKKIRNDQNYWEQVEGYLAKASDMRFSHSICPECFKKYAEPEMNA